MLILCSVLQRLEMEVHLEMMVVRLLGSFCHLIPYHFLIGSGGTTLLEFKAAPPPQNVLIIVFGEIPFLA